MNRSSGLFRREALDHLKARPWQPPLLSRPASGLMLTLMALASVGGLLSIASLYPFAQKENVVGHLVPGSGWARVTSNSYSVLRNCLVIEGEIVDEGNVLCELTSPEGLEGGSAVETRLLEEIVPRRHTLESRLVAVKDKFHHEKEIIAQERVAAETSEALLSGELEALEGRLAIARRQVEIGSALEESGVLSETDILELNDRLQSRIAETASKRRELEQVRTFLRSHPARTNSAESSRDESVLAITEELQALDMEKTKLHAGAERLLLAPRSGRVASIQVMPGASLVPGQHLMDIVPLGEQIRAVLFVQPAAMRKVEVGQRVRIYVDALPVERYGAISGIIQSVSETTIGSNGNSANSAYQVSVDIQAISHLSAEVSRALRPGMTVSADLVSGYSTVIDWLLDPVRRGTGRL